MGPRLWVVTLKETVVCSNKFICSNRIVLVYRISMDFMVNCLDQ